MTTATSGGALQRTDAAGVDALRLGIDWAEVQPARGEPFDWSSVDDVVIGASNRGIEVTPIIYGMPSRKTGRARSRFQSTPKSRAELRGWRRFVGAAVSRSGKSLWDERNDLAQARLNR